MRGNDDIEVAISAASIVQLDGLARQIWSSYSRQEIDEERAGALSGAIEARRRAISNSARVDARKSSLPLLTHPRPKERHSRRQALERRRRWAASGAIPPTVAVSYTVGELAVLAVVAREVQRTGRCDWPMDKIAAIAGVSRTTTRNALRRATDLGHVSVLERRIDRWRSDTNVVEVRSAEWRDWLRLRGGGGGRRNVTTTDTSPSFAVRSGDKSAPDRPDRRLPSPPALKLARADRLLPHPRR